MKRVKSLGLLLMLSALLMGAPGGEYVALGPAPYPAGEVTFETYVPQDGVVKPGEVSTYVASWNGIAAAEATLTIKNDPQRPDFLCARAEGKIVGSVSLLYAAEDSMGGCMNRKTLKPDLYSVRIRETMDYYDMEVRFDHDKQRADRKKVKRDGTTTEKDFAFHNAYCPVSTFLFVRGLPWKTGDQRSFEVIDGNGRYLLVVEAKEVRDITVPAGTFKSIRIEPSIFELPRDAKGEDAAWWAKQKRKDQERISLIANFELWMAVDGARPIVKGRADLYFGHVDLELASIDVPR